MRGVSTCDRVNLIVHRMTHLYQHTLHLHQSETELLLGPFVAWFFCSLEEKRITARMYHTARCLIVSDEQASLPKEDVNGVRFSAALRVAKIWHVYLGSMDSVSKDMQFGMYSGILMDIHWKIITSTETLPIHEVYRRKWAPEQISISEIVCPDNPILTPDGIENVWAEHIDDATRSNASIPKHSRPTHDRTTLLKNNSNHYASIKHLGAGFEESMFKPALVVWIKGLPCVNSIRYISHTLQKALAEEPVHGPLHSMVAQFVLGACSHARYIAPPDIRKQVYLSSPEESILEKIAVKRTPQETFLFMSEFLVAAAERHAGLWRVLAKDPGWKQYAEGALSKSDGYLRKLLYSKEYNTTVCGRLPAKTLYFQRKMTHSRIFSLLLTCMKIKTSIPSKVLQVLHAQGNVAAIYQTFRKQPEGIRVYQGILTEAGMSLESTGALQRCLCLVNSAGIKRSLSRCISSWNPLDKAVFHAYLHFLHHRSKLRLCPVVANPPPKGHEVKTERLPILLVCTNCFTIRSPRRGSTATKTSQEGTTLDTIDFNMACTSCLSTRHIRCVSLNRFKVWGLCVGSADHPSLITACRMCNVPTNYEFLVGDSELCTLCFRHAQKSLKAVSCICGVKFTTKFPCAATFLATKEKRLGLFALCNRHSHVLGHSSSPYTDISFYHKLISQRS